MYFKKLDIFGFKSFAEKTSLNFEKGITAIVGPNGCGKSNVFDSIRWVLGEQSIKELRGASREDVIFNGTDKKPSLGFAEVSLTLDNKSRSLEMDSDEVMITRRLYRSGESSYLLNKTVCRLKDIQELMMGTGMGAQAYSMVQQGRVDLVVNAKPEERRVILDEASGITKYKAKKKEALNKLKATEANLLRVNDITTEIRRQIGSIERQANKARRYKEQYNRLIKLEVKNSRYQIENVDYRKDKLTRELQELKDKEQSLSVELDELSNNLTNQINYLSELEQKINEINSEKIKLDGQVDIHSNQIRFNEERSQSLEEGEKRSLKQKEQLIEKCRLHQEEIENIKQEFGILQGTINNNDENLKIKKEGLLDLEKSIKEAKEKIRGHEEKILSLTSNQVNLRNELTDLMKDTQGAIARKRRLEIENEKVGIEKQEVDQKLQNIEYQINAIQGTVGQLNIQKQEKDAALKIIIEKMKKVISVLEDLERNKLFLRSQKDFIEKLNTQYDDIPDPIVEGHFISQELPLDHHTGIIGKVKEVRTVDAARFELLKQTISAGEAQNLYEIVCETKFIELDPQQISKKIVDINKSIVTYSGAKEEVSILIKRQRRSIGEITQEILEREKTLSVLLAQRNDIKSEAKKLIDELQIIDADLLEVDQSLNSLKKTEESANYKLDTVNQDIGWCQNDIKDKQVWLTNKSSEREEISITIAQIETELESHRSKLQDHNKNLKMYADTLDGWLEEIKTIDDEVIQSEAKREKYFKENEALLVLINELKTKSDSFISVLQETEAQKQDLGQRINSMKASMNAYEDDIDTIKQDIHGRQLNEQELNFSEQSIKDRLAQSYKIMIDDLPEGWDPTVEDELENVESETGESEETEVQPSEENAVDGQEQEISAEDKTKNALNNLVAAIATKPRRKKLEEETDLTPEQMEEEIANLKAKCDSFGNVNLSAVEEYEELKERFQFLTQQQADLLEAKSQLMSTINKINRSTKQMFMDTFTKVSEEFRIYFRMLFGGGEADLILLDPEDVLESGIEIVARPPGKKLQSISLLSGGEKTLTAIALIFGVFKVNPSPFCVLDEIDAALDESNVGRFSYLLKDFADVAQFIVITHNKKTIAGANAIYGITMPETGISKVVSVKFKEIEQKKSEAVPVGA